MTEIIADYLLLFALEHAAGVRDEARGFGAPCLRSIV